MSNEKVAQLSYRFNMSMGFAPIIATIVLAIFIRQDLAVYIGTMMGVVGILLSTLHKRIFIPNFILFFSTLVLALQSIVTTILPSEYVPAADYLGFTLEVSILIPLLLLYMHRIRLINYYLRHKTANDKRLWSQSIDAAVVSVRIALVLGTLHFIAISITCIFQWPLSQLSEYLLIRLLPPQVFMLTFVFNQIAINYFNRLLLNSVYLPVVNLKGDVTGKMPMKEGIFYKNELINPVIRIVVAVDSMLYLAERKEDTPLDQGLTDVPMESYLYYGETLTQGVNRMISWAYPENKDNKYKPEFSIVYHFENDITNRLNYLFILYLPDEETLQAGFKNGKLWNFKQIEENLGKGFFCSCFEEEYEHLKEVIYTKERYKAS